PVAARQAVKSANVTTHVAIREAELRTRHAQAELGDEKIPLRRPIDYLPAGLPICSRRYDSMNGFTSPSRTRIGLFETVNVRWSLTRCVGLSSYVRIVPPPNPIFVFSPRLAASSASRLSCSAWKSLAVSIFCASARFLCWLRSF